MSADKFKQILDEAQQKIDATPEHLRRKSPPPDQKLTDAKSDGNPITDVASRESEIAERWECVDGAVCDPAYEGSGFVNISGEGSIHIPDAANARLIVDKANELLTTLTRVRGDLERFKNWGEQVNAERTMSEAELLRVRGEIVASILESLGDYHAVLDTEGRFERADAVYWCIQKVKEVQGHAVAMSERAKSAAEATLTRVRGELDAALEEIEDLKRAFRTIGGGITR